MPVSLVPLKNGSVSLEFEVAEIDSVSASLRQRFGAPMVEKHPTLTVYKFKQADLVFQNEWDDPCLIAGTPEGIAMLKAVAADLS